MIDKNYKIILASKSPRRKQLLQDLGLEFELRTKDTDESFDVNLQNEEIPMYLSQKKAKAFESELLENEIVLTADTIVCINDKVLNKPESKDEAIKMLQLLSNNFHYVYTGVTLLSKNQKITFFDCTKVFIRKLSFSEIDYYLETCKPYDKAGSYGVQDWLGLSAIEKIEGSFYTVMGLPTHLVYTHLKNVFHFNLNRN
jgi:septum formation protein